MHMTPASMTQRQVQRKVEDVSFAHTRSHAPASLRSGCTGGGGVRSADMHSLYEHTPVTMNARSPTIAS